MVCFLMSFQIFCVHSRRFLNCPKRFIQSISLWGIKRFGLETSSLVLLNFEWSNFLFRRWFWIRMMMLLVVFVQSHLRVFLIKTHLQNLLNFIALGYHHLVFLNTIVASFRVKWTTSRWKCDIFVDAIRFTIIWSDSSRSLSIIVFDRIYRCLDMRTCRELLTPLSVDWVCYSRGCLPGSYRCLRAPSLSQNDRPWSSFCCDNSWSLNLPFIIWCW